MKVPRGNNAWRQIGAGVMAIVCAWGGVNEVAGQTGQNSPSVSMPLVPSASANTVPEPIAPLSNQPVTSLTPSGSASPTPELYSSAPAGLEALPAVPGEYSYNASGRREPFSAIVKNGRLPGEENQNLPPLQRIGLTELNLIGIIWGGFGYSAMVQAPDGKGYTVRQGTRIGPNNGTVSSITENAIIVHERFTDVYGNKQVREYVKLLHAKEGSE
ncbi:MAG: pilus assembly protein PilP [Nitrospiraceae bacterium]